MKIRKRKTRSKKSGSISPLKTITPKITIQAASKKNKGLDYWYKKRLADDKHPKVITFNFDFDGTSQDVKDIVRKFREITVEYLDDSEKDKLSPPLHKTMKEIAADFKYCYQQFEKFVDKQDGRKAWGEIKLEFHKQRIEELYDCINRDANISYTYDVPTSLILDKGRLSGNELKVLLAFMARAKKKPELGGIKVSGWGPEGLVRELGIKSRDTARKCIRKLENEGFIKLLPELSNTMSKTYRVYF